MAGEQESLNTRKRDVRQTRRRLDTWDRIKFLVFLAVVMTAMIAGSDDLGFLSLWDVIVAFFSSGTGRALGILFLLECLRQIHYWFSERSAALQLLLAGQPLRRLRALDAGPFQAVDPIPGWPIHPVGASICSSSGSSSTTS